MVRRDADRVREHERAHHVVGMTRKHWRQGMVSGIAEA
jgi:hypothetical protein